MKRYLWPILAITLSTCSPKPADPVSLSREFAPNPPIPEGSPLELGLAGYAKVFCSAVFVSKRDPEEAFENSGYFLMPDQDPEGVTWEIDSNNDRVVLTYRDSLTRSARYHGDQGCIIETENGLQFEPTEVISNLPDAEITPWPMGDSILLQPRDYDPELLQRISEAAFEKGLTAAFLVLHKGNILIEKYAESIDKTTQLESWSMGKSLTGTFIGRMIQMGLLNLDQDQLISEWSQEGDPRGDISIRDLMQMSSGLHFTAHRDPDVDTYERYLDHFYIYTGAVDAFSYSVNRPLQFPVGSAGRYRNCDPLTLGYIMKQTLTSKGENYLTWPQKELFDKIGIRKQVMETDPYGNFLLTGYDYGTARNWARLGQLYLQDGMWKGERILPEGWSKFVATKGAGWDQPIYGGMFWLNGEKAYPIPENSYYMAGGGGQRTIIIPEKEMVVVRLGHFRGAAEAEESLSNALNLLMNIE